MWKDIFNFTKAERRGIFVLILLIMLVIISPSIYDKFRKKQTQDYSEFLEAVEAFKNKRTSEIAKEQNVLAKKRSNKNKINFELKNFDPNTVSKQELINMGLPEKLSTTIINFRNSGGSFNRKEDMQKIYGMSDDIYNQMEPYILIKQNPETGEEKNTSYTHYQKRNFDKKTENAIKEVVFININHADTLELTKIRGIGQVFSRRIVSYRELLGGFHSKTQLLEVYGMDSLRYDNIKEHIYIEGDLQAININTAKFSDLISHPYINKNIANSIIKIREQHGKYNSIEEIKKSELISDNDYEKIIPYLKILD